MEEIIRKIRIIPLKNILVHERVVGRWVHNLGTYMEEAGIQKNPIVVHKARDKYIVLDGMHRVEALRHLGYQDIMVYEVDYFNEEIKLCGWDAIVFGSFNVPEVLKSLFSRNYIIRKESQRVRLQKLVQERKVLFGLRDRKKNQYAVILRDNKLDRIPHNKYLDVVISAVQRVENYFDNRNIRTQYVPEVTSDSNFLTLKGDAILYRPVFTKEDIIHRTLTGKIFPRKSTRHLIPCRPLRVDINLIILKEKMSLKAKNKLLYSHLMWCFKGGRVRYYPESVYIFAD
ncbi:MAG: ParB N-terminal domain-containing protein [bacterium]|nr:ParB N-terminal domain-containing protein [bacterium]